MQKNTIRDGISTALDAVYTVDTVYTALHCLNNSIHAYCLYILLEKVRTLWTGVDRSGYPLDCYNYESTCDAKSIIFLALGVPTPCFRDSLITIMVCVLGLRPHMISLKS